MRINLLASNEGLNNGLIVYRGGMFGRVIKVGQKNFGIEDIMQQNVDINYFANALKNLDQNQSADIVKIDRPVNLDGFASDLFARLTAVKESDEECGIKAIKENILRERIDRIIILIRLVIIMNRFTDLRLVRIMEKPYLLVRYAEMVIMKQMELCQRGIII